jgi:hypothetical protein
LPDRARDARRASKGDPDVRDNDRGSFGAIGLAGSGGVHARGDGEHRSLLEADLQPALEGAFTPLLVNARHIKSVPGRKTDVKDCEWIADLLRHGLLRGSFVPERPQRELRELNRYRTTLVRERSAEVGRLQKTLEGASIKLASVATDNIMGKSARQMLKALIDGSTDTSSAMAQNWLEGSCGRRSRNWSGLCGDVFRSAPALPLRPTTGAHRLPREHIEQLSAEIAERMGALSEKQLSDWRLFREWDGVRRRRY